LSCFVTPLSARNAFNSSSRRFLKVASGLTVSTIIPTVAMIKPKAILPTTCVVMPKSRSLVVLGEMSPYPTAIMVVIVQ